MTHHDAFTLFSPLLPGLAAAAVTVGVSNALVLTVLWKVFIFALLAIPGALLAETRPNKS